MIKELKLDKHTEKLLKKVKEEEKKLQQLQKETKKELKTGAKTFETEFKKNAAGAITAGFALIIGLAWKDVITEGIDYLVAFTGLPQNQAYGLRIVSAIVFTFICVVGIIMTNRFLSKKDKK